MVLSLINFHNLQLFHCQLLVLICIDKIFCPKPANNFSLQIELQPNRRQYPIINYLKIDDLLFIFS